MGYTIRSGQPLGRLATPPLPSGGVPKRKEQGTKSEVAHKWADWLLIPCRFGDSQRFAVRDKIRSGPQVGGTAT